MSTKFYSVTGEGEKLTPKQKKLSRESTEGCKQVFIKELRILVFTKANETEEETRERYLKNSIIGFNKN